MGKRLSVCYTVVIGLALLCAAPLAAADIKHFTLLHTNDEHSTLLPSPLIDHHPTEPNPAHGGFARLAAAVNVIRDAKTAADEPTLLLSGGDFLSGSPFAWLALDGQAPELALMQEIGYDAVALGNHEFDYGAERLADYLAAAGYPEAAARTVLLATNTQPPAGHPLQASGIERWHIHTLDNGLRVGLFALMGEHAQNVAPLAAPVTFGDATEAARDAVAALHKADVDLVIAITHSGVAEDKALANAVDGIDLIVGGHTHTALYEPLIVNDTIIVQAGTQLRYLGVLELAYDSDSQRLAIRNDPDSQPFLQPLDHSVPEDPTIAAAVDEYTQRLNALVADLTDSAVTDVTAPLIASAFPLPHRPPLQENQLGNFIVDAMRTVGEAATGEPVDFAVQANGLIRGTLQPGSMPYSEQHVGFMDLIELAGLGFGPDGKPGYPMVSLYFTSEEIRRIVEISVLVSQLEGDIFFLQFSGLRAAYDPARSILFTLPIVDTPIPTGRAVLELERYVGNQVQGDGRYEPIDTKDDRLYHVIADHYLAAFLPFVGEIVPHLGLVMKDRDGNPISADDAIVRRDGREVKTWQALIEYAVSQPVGPLGLPTVPSYYETTAGRLQERATLPLLLAPGLIAAAFPALIVGFVVWRRRR